MKQYLPDIDYWFAKYWRERGELTTLHIPVPEVLSDLPPSSKGSVIELLFSETFDYDDGYFYKFKQAPFTTFPNRIQERIRRKHDLDWYYFCSDSNEAVFDLFQFSESTLEMLDLLYNYRRSLPVDLSSVTYSSLGRLGKLIFIYLDLKLNNSYENLIYPELLPTSSDLLENLFEFYVLNESHKQMRTVEVLIDSMEENLKPVRKYFSINIAAMNAQHITLLGDTLPSDLADFHVYHNGELLNPAKYSLLSDSSSVIVSWADTDLSVDEGDTIITDYYVSLTEKTAEDLRTGLVDEEPVGEI